MTTISVAHPSATKTRVEQAGGAPRHATCDLEILDVLSDLFGIDRLILRKCFMGYPVATKSEAIGLTGWAMRETGWKYRRSLGDPVLAGEILLAASAAKKAKARANKRVPCAGCGETFPRRELVELREDNHDNLTHSHGDRLCGGCADDAGVCH